MQRPGRRCFFALIAIGLTYIILTGVVAIVAPEFSPQKELENTEWIATGKYWLDRQVCRWFGLCGTMHLNSNGWTWQRGIDDIPNPVSDVTGFWKSGKENPALWTKEEAKRREIPQYVFDHAPYVHLFSGEQFWPGDIADHLAHTTPYMNYSVIEDMATDRDLSNLYELNALEESNHGRYVYLQSDDNVEERPSWLGGTANIPSPPMTEGPGERDNPWSEVNDTDEHGFTPIEQRPSTRHRSFKNTKNQPSHPAYSTISSNGRCGGNSGYTCKGSEFGQCCSIYGWCGGELEYCESLCDPLAGKCNDPLHPAVRPKVDLKRRKRDVEPDLGPTKDHELPSEPGRSPAPAILIVSDKGNGVVDAFWFFFYSYNLGQTVLNIRFGNHVGDWEHVGVRFRDGKPESMFLSEHNFGQAYTFAAMEKYLPNPDGSGTMLRSLSNATAAREAKRPVVYSAIGSHANYATPGLHPYVLPMGLLHDQTDRGPLWDPALNVQSFRFDVRSRQLRSSTRNPKAPTGWFHYTGHWGDKYYPLSDNRQYRFASQYHYVNGPLGPRFKNLGRIDICQRRRPACKMLDSLGEHIPKSLLPPFDDNNGDEEGGLPGGNSTDDAMDMNDPPLSLNLVA